MSEGHAAAHTLLHPHVSRVTARLATGLGDQLAGVEEPEEALLEVLGAAHATAVKLWRRAQGSTPWRSRAHRTELAVQPKPHRGHDGVPRGREDVRVVVTMVVTLQLPAEILSGQLDGDTDAARSGQTRPHRRVTASRCVRTRADQI